MPAVTVTDLTTLPAVPALDRAQVAERPVRSVTTTPRGLEGEGFPVRHAFAGVNLADLDPFVHMDQMGEVEYAPGEPKGTPWHPQARGFETVTYMIDGTFQHQDSHGGGSVSPGTAPRSRSRWSARASSTLRRHPRRSSSPGACSMAFSCG